MIGSSVLAFLRGTTSMYPNAGCCDVSTKPKTHCSLLGALPLWFFGLAEKEIHLFGRPPKANRRVDQLSQTHLSQPLVYLASCCLCHLSFFWSICDRMSSPPVHKMAHFCKHNLDLLNRFAKKSAYCSVYISSETYHWCHPEVPVTSLPVSVLLYIVDIPFDWIARDDSGRM